MTNWSAGGVMLSGQRIHQTWTPRFLSVGVSQGQCVWEQSSNNRWTEGSNHRKDQANPQGEMCENHWVLRDVCKCAFNAEDNIWSTFWKEHKNYANWLRYLKLCGQIIHRLKFELTKFEEIWWTYVGLMNIFMGSVFFGSPCIIGWHLQLSEEDWHNKNWLSKFKSVWFGLLECV